MYACMYVTVCMYVRTYARMHAFMLAAGGGWGCGSGSPHRSPHRSRPIARRRRESELTSTACRSSSGRPRTPPRAPVGISSESCLYIWTGCIYLRFSQTVGNHNLGKIEFIQVSLRKLKNRVQGIQEQDDSSLRKLCVKI